MNSEIERMAKEAGLKLRNGVFTSYYVDGVIEDDLAKFAALVAEDCAKECDSLADGPEVTPSQQFALDLASDAIRAKFARGDLKDAAK